MYIYICLYICIYVYIYIFPAGNNTTPPYGGPPGAAKVPRPPVVPRCRGGSWDPSPRCPRNAAPRGHPDDLGPDLPGCCRSPEPKGWESAIIAR